MNRKGVCYDVGRVMYGNWRPDYDPKIVHRELEIMSDLHCNAVRICGRDVGRLMSNADDALKQGLEVWLSPELWNESPEATRNYTAKAAEAAEKLRKKHPDKLVLSVGSELTLFMKGIVPGRTFNQRLQNAFSGEFVKSGEHNKPLNDYLESVNQAVREIFRGKVTYASLIWEAVDWELFDFVSVDHYWSAKIKDRYVELLKSSFASGKPVVITEFGFRTYKGAATSTEGMAGDIIDYKPRPSMIASYLLNKVLSSVFGKQSVPQE